MFFAEVELFTALVNAVGKVWWPMLATCSEREPIGVVVFSDREDVLKYFSLQSNKMLSLRMINLTEEYDFNFYKDQATAYWHNLNLCELMDVTVWVNPKSHPISMDELPYGKFSKFLVNYLSGCLPSTTLFEDIAIEIQSGWTISYIKSLLSGDFYYVIKEGEFNSPDELRKAVGVLGHGIVVSDGYVTQQEAVEAAHNHVSLHIAILSN